MKYYINCIFLVSNIIAVLCVSAVKLQVLQTIYILQNSSVQDSSICERPPAEKTSNAEQGFFARNFNFLSGKQNPKTVQILCNICKSTLESGDICTSCVRDLINYQQFFCYFCEQFLTCGEVYHDTNNFICSECKDKICTYLFQMIFVAKKKSSEIIDKEQFRDLSELFGGLDEVIDINSKINKLEDDLLKNNKHYSCQPIDDLNWKIKLLSGCIMECTDCNEIVPFAKIISHANMHIFKCCCGFEPQGDLDCRSLSLRDHQANCVTDSCANCTNHILRSYFSEHENICDKRQICCNICDDNLHLDEYFSHCLQNSQTHQYISCPICGVSLFYLQYIEHFKVLHKYHSDGSCLCVLCDVHFINGETLFAHVEKNHPLELENALISPNSSAEDNEFAKLLLRIADVKRQESKNSVNETDDLLKRIDFIEQKACLEQESFVYEAEYDELKLKVETLQIKNEQLEYKISNLFECISTVALSVRKSINCRYDGQLTWPIVDLKEKIADSDNSIFSFDFYTSPSGYKMCLQVFLNGDVPYVNQYMSIYLVVKKSEHDAILVWPFSGLVTFMLINQQDKRNHWVKTFADGSFEQPVTEQNQGQGIGDFAPISFLRQDSSYVKDNTIFIKCFVSDCNWGP